MEQELIFPLEGLSSLLSRSLFSVGQSQAPHLAANSPPAQPGASLKSVTFNISQQSKALCLSWQGRPVYTQLESLFCLLVQVWTEPNL